jgi:methionyl-tRNA synthetase
VVEENFYFRLSEYAEKLLTLYEEQPNFIQPEARRNEVITFVKQGLKDLSITRTAIKWGIPVPDEPKHVFYVWFDALTTYMSAVHGDKIHGHDLWPADLHLIGKEIVRFHAIYWPAFLMAAGLPLPKRIFAHGWLLFENDKMSKSRGNIVRATPIHKVLGTDALRYFLLREVVFGQDGSFSYDALVGRYNSDLANGLGNLASRTLSMIHQYRGGIVPQCEGDPRIAEDATAATSAALEAFEKFEFSKALEIIWGLIAAVDKYIVEQAPWKQAKLEGGEGRLNTTLYTAAEALRIITSLLGPVLPESTAKIYTQLGYKHPISEVRTKDLHWGHLPAGQALGAVTGVFPRADPKLSIEKMKELETEEYARQQAVLGNTVPKPDATPPITIDDFLKVDLRVGVILDAAAVPKSDKLLHLHIDIGEAKPRSIVAGIAEAYKPEALVGRKVAIVANLAPRKLRGIESQGMIVAASLEGGSPALVSFLEDVPVGARLK